MKSKTTLKLGLLFALLLLTVKSNSQLLITNNQSFESQSLHHFTTILNVKDQNFSIQEVLKLPNDRFKPLQNENQDLGFTTDHYWLQFAIQNQTNKVQHYYLETARPIIDIADFYQIKSNGTITYQKSGDAIPFKERSFQHRKTIFKILLEPNQKTHCYLHLKSDGEVINVPVLLRTADNFISNSSFEQIVFGFFYGILIIAFILYFFFFYAMRQRVFLYYSLYVLFIGLLQFSLDGYFYQFITPNSGWLSNRSVLLFAVISGFFLGNYAQYYLNIKTISNRLYFGFQALYICFGVLFFVLLFVPNWLQYGYPAMNGLGLLLLVLICASLIEIYSKTKVVYQFFSLGILSLVTGFVIFILKNFSVLPNNFITENSSKLGTGLEIVFLSLSMASLIKKLKEDRESLQNLSLQKAEEMNELKTYFLSNISHELRTPLNTIINFIESINGETDSNSIQEKCAVIKSSSSGLLASVNDILDFSKIEKDEIKLEIADFDFHKLLEEVRKDILLRAEKKGLDFQFIQPTDTPKMIKGDASRIQQIIMNLLCNALKFTSEGIVKLKIETEVVNNTVHLSIIVSDTGEGIAKEKMNSIFDSFSQQTINNKRKYGGLGLGLYIVKALVNLHKGEIDLQSIVNQGTVCKVKLALEKVVVNEELNTAPTLEYNLYGKRILVVEDNAMNQMVLKMITKKWLNTEVDFANNGEEGLKSLEKTKYDIILMDLQMPVMDGYEATIAIRNGNSGINDKNIPIIAVTADVMESTKERVKEIGMNFYLSKPINKELLFETIQNCA